ncbi:MAG: response regulator [Candidatus Paceibacterota bacterium]
MEGYSIEQEQDKEKNKVIALYIDDSKEIIRLLKHIWGDNQNVDFIECYSVEDALKAIENKNPNIVFIDNSLSGSDTNEGLEIADRIKGKGIKIYSTTDNDSVALEYEKRGIEKVDKTDTHRIKSIVAEWLAKNQSQEEKSKD